MMVLAESIQPLGESRRWSRAARCRRDDVYNLRQYLQHHSIDKRLDHVSEYYEEYTKRIGKKNRV